MSINHNFSKQRRAETESNQGPTVCQPKRLTAGPKRLSTISSDRAEHFTTGLVDPRKRFPVAGRETYEALKDNWGQTMVLP